MAIDFPASPAIDQIHTVGNTTWKWNGVAWTASGPTQEDLDARYVEVAGDTMNGALSLSGTEIVSGGTDYGTPLKFATTWTEDMFVRGYHKPGVEAGIELVVGGVSPKTLSLNSVQGLLAPSARFTGAVYPQGGLVNISGVADFNIYASGANGRYINFEPNTAIYKHPDTPSLYIQGGNGGTIWFLVHPAGHSARLQNDGNFVLTGNGFKPGGGVWADASDSRAKDIIGDYTQGLDAVCSLQPKRYTFKAETKRDTSKVYIGPIAQDIEVHMPETVTQAEGEIGDLSLPDMRYLDSSAVVWALVNSVKELKSQVDSLKAEIATLKGA